MRPILICLLLVLPLGWTASAFAQDAPVPAAAEPGADAPAPEELNEAAVDRRVRRLSDELRSPFCPGKSIMTCTSSQAYTLRQEMRDMVLSGQSDEELIAALALRYGDDIRNPPQPWYTVLVPFLPFIFGAVLVFWILRRWRRGARAPQADVGAEAVSATDEARLKRLRARVAALDEE